MNYAFFAVLFVSISASSIRQLNATKQTSNDQAVIFTLLIILLLTVFCYDKRNGYRWINSIRHKIGEMIQSLRAYRKKKSQKQQRVETEQVLPTPKTVHLAQIQNQRPFIEAENNRSLQQNLCSPKGDPIALQEQQTRQQADLKNVFQARQSKSKSKIPKQKKSKSKLKSRLQSQTNAQEGEEKQGDQENSFNSDLENSIQNGRGSQVQ